MRGEEKLNRIISFNKLVIYGVGVILGAGIYALIGNAAGATGPSLWLSFLFAAVIASFTGLSYAELSSIKQTTASEYYYVKEGFKNKRTAFLTSWLITLVSITSITTVSLGFANYFIGLFFPASINLMLFNFFELTITPVVIVASMLILALVIINYIGIEESVNLNILFTLIETSGLLLIILLGGMHIVQGGAVPDLFKMPKGIMGVFGAVALVFFAYLGFEDLANLGEETKKAKTAIPKAIILSIAITTIIYILVSISAVTIVPWQQLASSPQPLADVANAKLGAEGGVLLSFIALFSTFNTVLIMITAVSRVIYGMAKDGSFPKILAKVSRKRKTPVNALITVAFFSIIASLMKDIGKVAELTTLGTFIVFGMINASLIKLRMSSKKLPVNRFKTPINIGKFPVLPLLGLFSSIWMIGTYLVENTGKGLQINLLNPSVIIVIAEIIIGLITYELLKRR